MKRDLFVLIGAIALCFAINAGAEFVMTLCPLPLVNETTAMYGETPQMVIGKEGIPLKIEWSEDVFPDSGTHTNLVNNNKIQNQMIGAFLAGKSVAISGIEYPLDFQKAMEAEPYNDPFARFAVTNAYGAVCYYAFVECKDTHLKEKIPKNSHKKAMKDSGEVDENSDPIMVEKTVDEFAMQHMIVDRGNKDFTILISAQEADHGRDTPVGILELAVWDAYLSGFHRGVSEWMTVAEYNEWTDNLIYTNGWSPTLTEYNALSNLYPNADGAGIIALP